MRHSDPSHRFLVHASANNSPIMKNLLLWMRGKLSKRDPLRCGTILTSSPCFKCATWKSFCVCVCVCVVGGGRELCLLFGLRRAVCFSIAWWELKFQIHQRHNNQPQREGGVKDGASEWEERKGKWKGKERLREGREEKAYSFTLIVHLHQVTSELAWSADSWRCCGLWVPGLCVGGENVSITTHTPR